MLTFCLTTLNAGTLLHSTLQRLESVLTSEEDVIVIDLGSTDNTLAELSHFMASHNGELIRLAASDITISEVQALTRQHARHPYVLYLESENFLHPDGVVALRGVISEQQPDLVVAHQNWWMGAPETLLDTADAPRIMGLEDVDLRGLTPDPSRMILHADLAARLVLDVQGKDSTELWTLYLDTARKAALCKRPIWAVPLRSRLAAPFFQYAAALPDASHRLNWVDDALYLTGPEEAPALLEACDNLLSALPPATVNALKPTSPVHSLLIALRDNDRAMALAELSLFFTKQLNDRNQALSNTLGQLRADLDLALPGPDYLRQLYQRIRAR